jgi:hypothetical protein
LGRSFPRRLAVGTRRCSIPKMRTGHARQLVVTVAVLGATALGLFASSPRLGAVQSAPVQKPPTIDGLLLRGTPEALNPNVARYWERDSQFESRLTLPADAPFETRSAFGKRQRQERSLFALFDRPDAGELAAQFVSEVDILYEWEGYATSALQEAHSALEFLKRHPATPLAPFVHFFVAKRYVCADEMPFNNLNDSQKREVADGVQRQLTLAGRTSNPLLAFLVEDFTRRPRCNDRLDTPR